MEQLHQDRSRPLANQRRREDQTSKPVLPQACSSATLSPSSMDEKIYAHAIDFIFQNQTNIIVNLALMPSVALFVLWSRVDHTLILIWTMAGISIAAIRYLVVSSYLKRKGEIGSAHSWSRIYALTSLMSGILWGSANLLFFTPDSVASEVFLLTIAIGLTVATLIVTAYHLPSYYAFALPAILITDIRLLMEGNMEYNGLAFLLLVFLGISTKIAHNTHKSVIAAIRLRFENLDLIEQLKQQKQAAEDANTAKSKFLAAASHDLRQPLHALSLFTALLDAENDKQKQRDLICKINHSQTALAGLLNTLLDISRLDAGIVEAELRAFSLQHMLERLIPEFEPEAKEKGLYLECKASEAVVISDPALLEIILRNLLINAIRYTHEGGISIQAVEYHPAAKDKLVRIEVADTGIGIPLTRQQEIFQEFHQLANTERDRAKGLGLGLAIVRRVSELLGHEINLESEVGKGSKFFVILPQGKLDEAVATTEHTPPVAYNLPKTVVMFIDDDNEIREGMNEALKEWGCTPMIAASGDDAVQQLQKTKQQPEVILADYRLRGGENGVDAIRRVCRETGKKIPALIITGDTAPERLREAKASGYTLLHKPLQPAQIRAFIRHAVQPSADKQ
ncbi:hypothetical protein MNBD_GAMMA24-964 [hydrothermal vent metagenome]|uniref:Histidine kinase n=1 Tax=hydrothermal vent metagenome TaxID=652676 RepID=A0A3B1BRZ1_9ZZZZ